MSAMRLPRRVDGPLEVGVQLYGLRRTKRREVAVDRAADPSGWVYPEVAVEQPGPATAVRPAHSRDVFGVEQQAVAPLVSRADGQCVGRRRVGGGDLRRKVQFADLVGERGLDGGLGQDADTV